MGLKNSCMRRRNSANHGSSTTDWKDIEWNTLTPEKQPCIIAKSKEYIIKLELQELESQIQHYINNKNPTEDDVQELEALVKFKELKTKELNCINGEPNSAVNTIIM